MHETLYGNSQIDRIPMKLYPNEIAIRSLRDDRTKCSKLMDKAFD